ncbi:MAG: hypothetical protein HZC42_14065 [Candidatus Eisenbacteria bacterium]|nr:hypothetical protein [Candidatus Eisenbacteria bacterium]
MAAPRTPAKAAWAVAPLALVLALAVAAPACAGARPELAGAAGATLGVLGPPDGGGASLSAAALWPVGYGLRFGLSLFAEDMGSETVELTDIHDGSDLGSVAGLHRMALGAAWRLDGEFAPALGWIPFGSATWGIWRVSDDVQGRELGAIGSTGFSLGGGLRHAVGRFQLGASVRYHRLFNERVGRFVAAGVDWSWR